MAHYTPSHIEVVGISKHHFRIDVPYRSGHRETLWEEHTTIDRVWPVLEALSTALHRFCENPPEVSYSTRVGDRARDRGPDEEFDPLEITDFVQSFTRADRDPGDYPQEG